MVTLAARPVAIGAAGVGTCLDLARQERFAGEVRGLRGLIVMASNENFMISAVFIATR